MHDVISPPNMTPSYTGHGFPRPDRVRFANARIGHSQEQDYENTMVSIIFIKILATFLVFSYYSDHTYLDFL